MLVILHLFKQCPARGRCSAPSIRIWAFVALALRVSLSLQQQRSISLMDKLTIYLAFCSFRARFCFFALQEGSQVVLQFHRIHLRSSKMFKIEQNVQNRAKCSTSRQKKRLYLSFLATAQCQVFETEKRVVNKALSRFLLKRVVS